MSEQKIDLPNADAILRLVKHLPSVDDTTLIVLKGHLLIEEQLVSILESSLKYPRALDKARLTFAQRISLVKALKHRDENSWVWEAIGKLNSIRNDLAHKLELPKLNKKIEDFFTFIKSTVPIDLGFNNENEAIESRLRSALAFLHGVFIRGSRALGGITEGGDRASQRSQRQ